MKCRHCNSEWKTVAQISVSMRQCPFCGKPLAEETKADTTEGVIATIYRDYGESELRNGKHLLAFFADLAPGRKKEKLILSRFIACGGHTILLDAKLQNADPKLFIERIVYKMTDELLLPEQMSRQICEGYWIGIGGSFSSQSVGASEEKTDIPKKESLPKKWGSSATMSKQIAELTPEEQFQKGHEFYNGCGKDAPDYSKAFEWYSKAANRGHALAQCQLGLLYRDGKGVSKDEKQAFAWFTKAASVSQNCPRGKFYVGRCYAYGTGVAQNIKEAIRWYTLAAQQGDAYAQINLGLCYKWGTGVDRDYAKAAQLFTDAAAQGDSLAHCHLGLLYKEGQGVPKNVEKAFEHINRSAQDGESYGQLQLGYLYRQGVGTERDLNAAFHWYKLAAEQGDEDAQEEVGNCYQVGRGISKNEREAVSWYEKAIASGSRSAIYELAQCYEEGLGVTQDYVKAVSLYQQAADLGVPMAAISLAECYAEGKGVPKDEQKALAIYEKAANSGDPLGLVAVLEEYGNRDKVTTQECLKLINIVRKNADVFNDVVIELISGSCMKVAIVMLDYPETKSEGITWIQKCAEKGLARAQVCLGYMYSVGYELPKDEDKAVFWFEKAAEQGDIEAKKQLKVLRKKGLLSFLFG